MKKLDISNLDFNCVVNICYHAVGKSLGSLEASKETWSKVVKEVEQSSSTQWMDRLVKEAVPEEADPHPQRAECDGDIASTWFVTPGNVIVKIAWSDCGYSLSISFQRDSQCLAWDLCVRIDRVYPIPAVMAGLAISRITPDGNVHPTW